MVGYGLIDSYRLLEIKHFLLFVLKGESIKKANEQIAECKKELEEAKTIRKNRQGEDLTVT